MIIDDLSYDVQTPLTVTYVGDYKYLAVDGGFNEIVATFDSHSDLSKWLLSQQDRQGSTHRVMYVCRVLTSQYDLIVRKMQTMHSPLRDVIAVRSTLRNIF